MIRVRLFVTLAVGTAFLATGCETAPAGPSASTSLEAVCWYSPNRRFYLSADPSQPEWALRQVGRRDRVLWSVPAGDIRDEYVPSDDGRRLVRLCRTPDSPEADAKAPALEVFEDGLPVARYTVAEVAGRLGGAADGSGGAGKRPAWRTLPEADRPWEGVSADGRFLDVTTADSRLVRLELASGRIVQGLAARADPEVAEQKAHFAKARPPAAEVARGKFRPRGLAADGPGNLMFVDAAGTVGRVALDGAVTAAVLEGLPGEPGSLAFAPDSRVTPGGGLTVALAGDGRVVHLPNVADPPMRVLADSFAGRRFFGPTGLIYDDRGNLFFADAEPNAKPGVKNGSIYLLTAAGKLYQVARNLESPTGLAFNGDGSELYAAERGLDRILAFPVDRTAEVPALGKPRVFARLPVGSKPAGLARDIKGNIYAAAAGAGRIEVFARSGEPVGRLPTGGEPTHLAFGIGRDAEALFVSVSDRNEGRLLKIDTGRVGQAAFFPRRAEEPLKGGKPKMPDVLKSRG